MSTSGNDQSISVGNVGRDVNSVNNNVSNVINNNYLATAAFGRGTGSDDGPSETRSGRVESTELAAIRSAYVARPLDDRLSTALATDHLVLLQGRPGWGRRSAAVRALATVAADRVNVLDVTRVKALRDIEYADGEGYYYDASAITWDDADWSDASLGVIRSRVAAAGAYLVVTLPASAVRPDLPCRFSWARITVDELLDAAPFHPPLPDGVALVEELAGGDASVFEVTRLLAHLRGELGSGRSLDDAIAGYTGSRRAEIHDWLESVADRDTAAMVTCLCFLGGTSETVFDTAHLDLLDALSSDDDEDERKIDRQNRFVSRGGLIERCRGQRSTAARDVARLQMDVPVIDLKDPGLAATYVAELWQSRPNAFRREIVLWLRRVVPTLGGDDLVAAAGRVAWLADVDLHLLRVELLEHWIKRTPYEAFLAAGILQMVADRGRSAQALQIAVQWRQHDPGTRPLLAATYFFTFTAVDHPENALTVFRRKSLRVASGPTRQAALEGWRLLAIAATERESTAVAVTRYLRNLDEVRQGKVDDPVFVLLDRWFAGDRKRRPLALGAAAQGAACEESVAAILASVSAKTHARLDWYRPLVGYLDSGSATTDELAGRLIEASLRPLAPERRQYVVGLLLDRIRRWNRQPDGPSGRATERAEQIIRRTHQRSLS